MTRSAKLEPLPNAPVVSVPSEPTKADERSDKQSFFIAADVKVQSIETIDVVDGTFTTTFRAIFIWPLPKRLAGLDRKLDPKALRSHLDELGEWPRFDMINLVETEGGHVESTCKIRNIRVDDIITDIDGDMDDDVAPEQEFLRCIEAKIFYKHARVQTRSDALSKLMSHGMQARDEVEFGQEEENTVESSNSRMYPFDVHRLTFGWVIRRPKLSTAEAWRSAKQAREDDTDWAWYKELPDETVTTLAKTKREFGKTFKAVRPRGRARENRPSHTLSLTLSLIGRRPISAPPRYA